jgi:hypothetical protein
MSKLLTKVLGDDNFDLDNFIIIKIKKKGCIKEAKL